MEKRRRYSVRKRSLEPTEAQIQRAVLQLLSAHPKVAWCARINTGAWKVDNRYIKFGFKGCPDIIGQMVGGGRFLAIECKTAKGKLTDYQRNFLNNVLRYYGVAGVAHSADDAKRIVEEA